MAKFAQIILGPAGAGKSTLCKAMLQHLSAKNITGHIVNLDPAADRFEYEPSVDVRDLVTLEEVMDDLKYGPNGGLVKCFEILVENVDWLKEKIGDLNDDYLLVDFPGQIELYTHLPITKHLVQVFQDLGYKLCCLYLLDSHFIDESSKFCSGVLAALSVMIQLEIPHINIMSKMDLVPKEVETEDYTCFSKNLLANKVYNKKFQKLSMALGGLIEEYSMVMLFPLNITSMESMDALLYQIHTCLQYDEDQECLESRKD